MFIGREKEIQQIKSVLDKPGKQAIMLYGKRRVGKSSLIIKSIEDCKSTVIYYECLITSLEDNLDNLEGKVKEAMNNKYLHFGNFQELFQYFGTLSEKITIIIDEYSYLKNAAPKNYVDSMFQTIIDSMSDNIHLVLLGSYVGMMCELLEKENPLFGRFSLVMNVRPFDYYDSALFYPDRSVREKIELYSIFGGVPFALCVLDQRVGLQKNVENLMLEQDGVIHIYIENILLAELSKVSNANLILSVLSNGKKRYSEIESILGLKTNGGLDKQLKTLLEMEIINKVYPLNKTGDRKKTFYEISDNLVRFYYCYVYKNKDVIARIGERAFYNLYIAPSISTFVAHRFEEIARQYFARRSRHNDELQIYDIGTLWYDNPLKKTNGEFDCVLKHKDSYSIYEVKFHEEPMDISEAEKECEQIRSILPFVTVSKIGFISASGFLFQNKEWELITGEQLYMSR